MGDCYPLGGSPAKPDALLIAAAPELLAALESLMLFTNPKPSNSLALHAAYQAITKAKGLA